VQLDLSITIIHLTRPREANVPPFHVHPVGTLQAVKWRAHGVPMVLAVAGKLPSVFSVTVLQMLKKHLQLQTVACVYVIQVITAES
jgi:hypothetical protein